MKSFVYLLQAGLRLVNFDLYENRTVYHDFFTKFGQTTIYVRQKPQGNDDVIEVKSPYWGYDTLDQRFLRVFYPIDR